MITEKLSLDHKDLLRQKFQLAGAALSDYSFANLYLFRDVHDYHVLTEGDAVYVSGKTYDGVRFLMPTEKVCAAGTGKLLEAAQGFDMIFPVPEEWLAAFGEKAGAATFSGNDSDYVYTAEKLSTYKGHKLHGQKNILGQFLDRYTPEAKPLTEDRIKDSFEILETWQQDVGEPPETTDYGPCRVALRFYDTLVLCGGIYYVEGEPAGFVIGEEILPDMFALHFAKGKRKFKGIYQYMYNHFANILPKKYAFLNFEQDLGKLALRIAKSSYDPDRTLKKYRVRP